MAAPGAPGATASRANTVTLGLTQGESPNPTATFSPKIAARQVTVGSGPEAQWKVRGQGVEPVHAALYWDGSAAFIRDAGSLSGVYVGVARVDDWRQLYDGDEVMMGQAVLRARVVGPDAHPPAAPSTPAPPASGRVVAATTSTRAPASASFLEEESTMVFQGNSAALAMAAASAAPAPAPRVVATVSTPTMAPGPHGPASVPPPRATAQETVIRMSPYADLPPPSGEATMMHTDLPAQAQVPPPSVAAPRAGATGLPGGLTPVVPGPTGTTQAMVAPPADALHPSTASPFGDDPFGTIPPPAGSTEVLRPTGLDALAARLGTQSRTLLLGVITLAVAMVGLLLPTAGPSPTTLAPGTPPHATSTPAATGAIVPNPGLQILTTPALPPPTNNILQLPMGSSGLVGVILPGPMGGTDASGHPIPLPPSNPNDPIRLAAEAVATHHWADAATRYEALAAAHPEAPLFRHFAIVLRARMAAPTCQPGDPGCTPNAPAAAAQPGS